MSGNDRSLFPPAPVDRLRAGRRVGLCHLLDGAAWAAIAVDPPAPGAAPLLALWAEADGTVRALFHEGRARPVIVGVATEAGRYHALSARLPSASPWERRVRDLHGFEAMHALDLRPLLDHGAWTAETPLGPRSGPAPRAPAPVEWIDGGEADDGLALIEEGPVGAPALLRTRTATDGARIRRLEVARGYGHRGLLALMRGLAVDAACRVAARIDAAAAVAHATAFARAVENALAIEIPPAASALRALAGEAEHASAHAATIARAAADGGCTLLASAAAALHEGWRDAAELAFGHRFAAGFVRPGGVSAALDAAGRDALGAACARSDAALAVLLRVYEGSAGLAPLLGSVGLVTAADALRWSAGGVVGRASGSGFDARRIGPGIDGPTAAGSERGTADARFRLRLAAIAAAAASIRRRLDRPVELAADAAGLCARVPFGAGEGIGVAEAPEGDVWHVVRLAPDATVAHVFARDPAVAHAALFERASAGAPPSLRHVLRRSFGLSSQGLDL